MLVVDRQDVERAMPMSAAIDAMREVLMALDRGTAVAELVPVGHTGTGLSVRSPIGRKGGFATVVLPPPLKLRTDPLDLLKLERQSSR